MVKPIKKRVPKSQRDQESQAKTEGSEDAQNSQPPQEAPEPQGVRQEIQSFAQDESADRFSEIVEGFFLGIADRWVLFVVLLGIGTGTYGFFQYEESARQDELSTQRVELLKVQSQYQALKNRQESALKARVKEADNPLGLSIAPQGESQGPKAEDFTQIALKFKKLKLTKAQHELARLGQASALFDAAESSEDYQKAAQLFAEVGSQVERVELFARGIALQNAAIAYEEAARLAPEADQAEGWKRAVAAWENLREAHDAFKLNASLNRARVLRQSGQREKARAAYQELKVNYAKNAQSARVMNEVKIGLALLASPSKPTQDSK
jgi:tetratricopeptide (TPR) repeat protein